MALPEVIKLRTWSASKVQGVLKQDEVENFQRYATRAARNEELNRVALRCMRQEKSPFFHPFTGNPVPCRGSLSHENTYNIVAFGHGDELVFVIQRVSSIEALYFPRRNLLISFRLHQDHIEKLFSEIKFEKFPLKEGREFAGFILSHHRPYHLFYDVLPAFTDIDRSWEGSAEVRQDVELVQLQGVTTFRSTRSILSMRATRRRRFS